MEINENNQPDIADVVNTVVSKKVDTTLDLGAKALQSPEVQEMLKAYGLDSYIKNVRADHVKNILSLAGIWYVGSKFKKHLLLLSLAGVGMYIYAKSGAISHSSSIPLIADNTDSQAPVIETNQEEMSGNFYY